MNDKTKQVPEVDYTEDEKAFRSMIIERMEHARRQREQQHPEFDDMTYEEYWESNAKAANAYMPPKKNAQDTRTTSGTTKEKTGTLLSSILNYNFAPDVEAYDKDDLVVQELGTIMEDFIKKSRKIEKPDYEVKRPVVYKELFDQGTVCVEDVQVEFALPNKVAKNFKVNKLKEMEWSERMDKVYKFCSTNVLCGLDVYFGNIREFYLELQPYIATKKKITRGEAQSIYGTWERWENVPVDLKRTAEDGADSLPFNNWSLGDVEKDTVEVIKYYDKWANDFMILLNGVMMFPVRRNKKGKLNTFPLSSLNGECEYPLSKGDIDPISRNFAYSKSIPAKTKVDQALFDEMLKAIVLKTRKSYQPPMANNTGKMLSKKIFYPGTIHSGINPEKLQEIGENKGVTQSEFNSIQFIKQIIDEKSVSNVFEGQASKGQQTAREVTILKQQSMMKLGLAVTGVINLEKSMCKLRLNNILKYWTEPIDKRIVQLEDGLEQTTNLYKTISIDTEFEEGKKGQRIVDFTEEEMPTSEQVYAEEQLLSELNNREYRKHYINPKLLNSLDYNWYIEIVPTEKNTSELKVAMFEDMVQKMMAMFIPLGKMPNLDYIATRWATLQGEDPNRLFPPAQQQPMPMGMGAPGQPNNTLQNQLTPNRQSQTSLKESTGSTAS